MATHIFLRPHRAAIISAHGFGPSTYPSQLVAGITILAAPSTCEVATFAPFFSLFNVTLLQLSDDHAPQQEL